MAKSALCYEKGGAMFEWLYSFLFDEEEEVIDDEPLSDQITGDYTYEVTDDFEKWAESADADAYETGLFSETEEDRMCSYIIETKKSPYKDDENLEKAKALLERNYIYDFNFGE